MHHSFDISHERNSPFPFVFFHRAEGSNLLLDPHLICKKPRRLRGKLHDICKTDTSLMDEIARGISMGFRECEYQFKYRRWNCSTAIKRNMKKILSRGKFDSRIDLQMHHLHLISIQTTLSVVHVPRVRHHQKVNRSSHSDVMISFRFEANRTHFDQMAHTQCHEWIGMRFVHSKLNICSEYR